MSIHVAANDQEHSRCDNNHQFFKVLYAEFVVYCSQDTIPQMQRPKLLTVLQAITSRALNKHTIV
jgi:hypothetical protein